MLPGHKWHTVSTGLENWVRSVAVDLPLETDWSQSNQGSWYIHPRQHGLEITGLSFIFACSSLFFLYRTLRPGTFRHKLLSSFTPAGPSSVAEKTVLLLLCSSLTMTLVHKIQRRAIPFMLQPCHMSALLLIFIMSYPNKSSAVPQLLFNIYLHTLWGAIAALAFPDLREHYLWGETFNFYAEHILILVAPVYMLLCRRYLTLPTSPTVAMFASSVYSFFHTPVLHFFALKTGLNLNYLFSPPPVSFLIRLGPMYRFALCGISISGAFITRYILVGGALALAQHPYRWFTKVASKRE